MNSVEDLIEKAQTLQDKGDIEPALEQFSQAFDALIDQAGKYALEQEGENTDLDELRAHADRLFAHATVFLKRDITAAYVLNAMGVLFGQMKEYENAQQKLMESITYIPDGADFNDPADNLERLSGEIAAAQAAAEEMDEEIDEK